MTAAKYGNCGRQTEDQHKEAGGSPRHINIRQTSRDAIEMSGPGSGSVCKSTRNLSKHANDTLLPVAQKTSDNAQAAFSTPSFSPRQPTIHSIMRVPAYSSTKQSPSDACLRFLASLPSLNLQSHTFLSRHVRLLEAAHAVQAPSSHHRLVLVPRRACRGKPIQPRHREETLLHSQGVVSICSPVNTAFAPARKHIACCVSSSVCLPAASRMIVPGRTIRAVAIVRRIVWYGTGWRQVHTR